MKPNALKQKHPSLAHLLGWRVLLLLLALIAAPVGKSYAQTSGCMLDYNSPNTQGTVSFSPPTTISVPFNTPVGTVLWSSPIASANPPPIYDCYGSVPFGIANALGVTPGAGVSNFPTGVAGLSYQIIRGGSILYSWPNSTLNAGGYCQWSNRWQYWNCNNGSTYTFSVNTQLNLVKTGQIATGSTLPASTLGYWQYQGLNGDGSISPVQIIAFTTTNSVTIVDPACAVTTNPINVSLPTITSNNLASIGATAGTTAFSIKLNCPSGASGMTLSIQLDYNGSASGIQGVLLPTGGTSGGVGVQILSQSGSAVTFGSPATVGTTVSGSMNIPYSASYYRTGTVKPGSLTASATFTVSYQ